MPQIPVEQTLHLAADHHRAGRLPQAEELYRQVLAINPDQPDALHLLGVIATSTGRPAEAVDLLQKALAINPNFPNAQNSLGNAFKNLGQLEPAAAAFRKATQLNLNFHQAHTNLGNILKDLGQINDAVDSHRRAIAIRPDFAEAHHNLGNALCALGNFDLALASCQTALQLKPDYLDALNSLGNILKDLGQLDAALAAWRKALTINPHHHPIHSNILFTLPFHPASTPQSILKENRDWNDRHAAPLAATIKPHTNTPDPNRPLNIGYISPEFRKHCQSHFTIPLLSNHDRTQFKIHCYADVLRPDSCTDQLRAYADLWRNTRSLTDAQLADEIRADQIDILIDLTMHMASGRPLTFARKPAPIQIAWLAYPGTTGIATIDYRLTDPHLDPPNQHDDFYSERSLRLPDSFWCYDPLTTEPAVNPLPALVNKHITFGCLNNFCKINDPHLALWSQILQNLPPSRMIILAPQGEPRRRLITQLHIDPTRITFVDRLPRPDYLHLYHQIDLCLDTFPSNGHTTSLDALWMGVPTVTLAGQTAVSRAGLCQLSNLHLPDFITHDPASFVATATSIAQDIPRLADLRTKLRLVMQKSPLMDAPRFAKNIESLYRQAWIHWCNRQKPTPQ